MGYVERGGILVPDNLVPHVRSYDDLRRRLEEDLTKSLAGQRPVGTPRHVLPMLYRQGLYRGVRDPEGAQRKTADFLRKMAETPLIRAIHSAIIMEAETYAKPALTRDDRGFEIYMADEAGEPTSKDKERMQEITDLLMAGGVPHQRKTDGAMGPWSGDQQEEGDRFPTFAQKALYDSLALDWSCWRIEPGHNRRAYPVAFMKAMDSATVRFVDQVPKAQRQDQWGNKPEVGYIPEFRRGQRVEFVELDEQGRPANEYTWDEVVPFVRNGKADLAHAGYGWPELASLVEIVAGMLTSVEHNVNYFTTNSVPPGIVAATGDWDQEWLETFLWELTKPGSGGDKINRLPLLFGAPDAKMNYLPFRQTEKQDMYWKNWLSFLMAVACAVYHVAAEDVNFQAFLTVGGMQTGTGGDERVRQQRSKGFFSIMGDLADTLNLRIVSRFYADSTGYGPYRLRWRNLVPTDEEKERQYDTQDLQNGVLTINEVRARRDMRPIKDPLDRALYQKIEQYVADEYKDIARYRDRYLDLCERIYENKGGKWAMWPDAPVNAGLQMIWQQEHEQDLAPQQDEGDQWLGAQQGGPPQNFQDMMQVRQWQHAQKGGGEQDQAGGEQEPEPQQQAAPPGMQKSVGGKVLEVVVRPQ